MAGGGSGPSGGLTAREGWSPLEEMDGDEDTDEVARWLLIASFARSLACDCRCLRPRSWWRGGELAVMLQYFLVGRRRDRHARTQNDIQKKRKWWA